MFGFESKALREAKVQIANLEEQMEDLKSSTKKRLAEATYLFSGDLTPGTDDRNADRSDLNKADFFTLQKQCYDIFKIFPYAKRVIEMITDFVIGNNLTYSVSEKVTEEFGERVERHINDFWNDYDNDIPNLLEGMCNELWILGEQIYPYTFEETTNILKLGIIDPRMVERIVRDPKNQKRLYQVIMQSDTGGNTKVYGVANEYEQRIDVDPRAKRFNSLDYTITAPVYGGDCLLFNINRLPTQTRGYSELATIAETLDNLDQFLFEVTERSLLMFHFIADVLIKNKSEEEIKNFKVPNMKKNTVFKHSQNVELDIHSPDLNAPDIEGVVKIIREYILTGVGIPSHWVVDGGNTNRATAKEMNTPIEKRLQRKQGIINAMLKKMIRLQLEHRMNVSPEAMNRIMDGITLDFPPVSGVDHKVQAQVLVETAKALVVAVSQQWVTGADAGNEFIKLANSYGMELSALHLDEKEQAQMKAVTGKEIKDVNGIQSYFKSIDQQVKDQGNKIVKGLVPAKGN